MSMPSNLDIGDQLPRVLTPQTPGLIVRDATLGNATGSALAEDGLAMDGFTRTRSNSRVQDVRSWWRLVWVCERCLKHENEARRKIMSEVARECGSLLICLKKANKFEKWLTQEKRPPYVLLTDSKELRASVQVFSTHGLDFAPAFIITLCEPGAQFDRAASWVKAKPMTCPRVHLLQQIHCSRTFVGSVFGCLVGRNDVPIEGSASGDFHSDFGNEEPTSLDLQSGNLTTGTTRAGRARRPARGRASKGLRETAAPHPTEEIESSVQPYNSSTQDFPAPFSATADLSHIHGQVTPVPASPVPHLLTPACGAWSSGQVEQLLKQAMPDHYDE